MLWSSIRPQTLTPLVPNPRACTTYLQYHSMQMLLRQARTQPQISSDTLNWKTQTKVMAEGLQPYEWSPAVTQTKCWPVWMQSVCPRANPPRTRWIWAIPHHSALRLGITPCDIAHIFYFQMRKLSSNDERQANSFSKSIGTVLTSMKTVNQELTSHL